MILDQINTLSCNKHIKVLLLQHNNSYACFLERCIFEEAITTSLLICDNETNITPFKRFLSRRKIQTLIGNITYKWILNNTILEKKLKQYCNSGEKTIILFLNSFFTEIRYPAEALKYLKKKYNATFVLYYIDPIERGVSHYANYLREKNVFDQVYTFDKNDSKRYNLTHWQTPYSKLFFNKTNIYDLYFSGVDTDRIEIIEQILKNKELNCKFDLVQLNKHHIYNDKRVHVEPVENIRTYDEVLKNTLQANCILEIVRPGQVGFTLRTFEAVVYNKKLLTNNSSIVHFKFYNPKFMKIFSKVEDIDWDWLMDKSEVEYHYDGSFSPINFIKEIASKI